MAVILPAMLYTKFQKVWATEKYAVGEHDVEVFRDMFQMIFRGMSYTATAPGHSSMLPGMFNDPHVSK